MSDQGFQAYKGDSSELIMEERPDRAAGDSTALHMQNFLACVKSRREQDLHDPIANAVPSAALLEAQATDGTTTGPRAPIAAATACAGAV